MTAEPSSKGVLTLLQALLSSFTPAFWKITPQIPPPANSSPFAALTQASTLRSAQDPFINFKELFMPLFNQLPKKILRIKLEIKKCQSFLKGNC